MGKQTWKAGNMLYPLPAVMVSVRGKNGEDNIITVAWAGTVCTNPPMVSISVRPERYSYQMIKESGAFVINLTTEDLCYATDYCGVRSGRDVDKFKEMKLTKVEAEEISAPMIGESPVNIECKVEQVLELGSHHMFLAKVVAVHAEADSRYPHFLLAVQSAFQSDARSVFPHRSRTPTQTPAHGYPPAFLMHCDPHYPHRLPVDTDG